MKYTTLCIIVVFLGAFFSIADEVGDESFFPRYPALSSDGAVIAFSYAGDIWSVATTGGVAQRLTTNPAYERLPRWSPDGKWIAYSLERDGYDDIYVIPSTGGKSRRLTYLDASDEICDWTPDGKSLIFASRRDDVYPDFSVLYKIDFPGGTPEPISTVYGCEAVFNSDGKRLLLTTGDAQWWRKGYRSSGSAQVWLLNIENHSITSVTDTSVKKSGSDFIQPTSRWPLWGNNELIYVVSERDGTANLWRRLGNESWEQVTFYSSDGVRFPSISKDGKIIAYEQGTDIYVIMEENEPRRLSIIAPIDQDTEPRKLTYNDRAERVVFSPDGRQMFLEVRGNVVVGRIVADEDKAARGRAVVISQTSEWRDELGTLSPGGDSLIIVSDRSGNRDLYLVTSNDPETSEFARSLGVKVEQFTDSESEDQKPIWSPDGQSVAFVRGAGDLIVKNLLTKNERKILDGWSLNEFVWSPDSKWIAFSREDDDYNSDVWVVPSTGGEPTNISRHPDDDDKPVWSDDGRKLGFRSRRRENNWDIYFVFLRKSDDEKTSADWAEEALEKTSRKKDKAKNKKDDKKGEEEKKNLIEVSIDTTDIYKRVRPVANLAGEEGVFIISPDGKKFVFSANHEKQSDIYAIDWSGENLKRLTNNNVSPKSLAFDETGKRIRFLDGTGRVKSVDVEGGSQKDHPFEVRITVEANRERKQKFYELWRVLNDRFYDPDFHGCDWVSMRDKYRLIAERASCEEDFADVVRIMLGELNSSHSGYNQFTRRSRVTGRLGLDFAPSEIHPLPGNKPLPKPPPDGAGLQIANVLADGPCDKSNSKVEIGEWLTSVNGVRVSKNFNIYSVLDDQVNQRTELTIWNGKNERRIIVRPIGHWDETQLRYNVWVESRSRMVDSLSGGKLGYLHIRGMGEGSLARFEAELFSVGAGKDGLVVDVRYNGGGWTTDWLLAMLQVRRHATTFPRNGGPGYPQGRLPLYSWSKPVIVLCNENSFSNAEIFSHSMKTLGRATLVGVPTPGGVISTGEHVFVDGSSVRVPLRGWYIGELMERNRDLCMEGRGAVPDVIVPLLPGQMLRGEDDQLNEAVSQLLNQID